MENIFMEFRSFVICKYRTKILESGDFCERAYVLGSVNGGHNGDNSRIGPKSLIRYAVCKRNSAFFGSSHQFHCTRRTRHASDACLLFKRFFMDKTF